MENISKPLPLAAGICALPLAVPPYSPWVAPYPRPWSRILTGVKTEHLCPQWIWACRVEQAEKIKFWGGVYYLLTADGRINYIGRSNNMNPRIEIHRSRRKIPFDYVAILYVEDKALQTVREREAIRYFRPPYNQMHNPDYVK